MRFLFYLVRQWWVLAAIAVFGAFMTARTAMVLLKNGKPTEETCAGYAINRPTATWLRLRDCAPLVDRAVVSTSKRGKAVFDVYVPFGEPNSESVAIVVRMKDPAWKRLADDNRPLTATELDRLSGVQVLEGMLDYQSTKDRDLDEVRKLVQTADAPIFLEGERPSRTLLYYQLLLTIVTGTAAAMLFRSAREGTATSP
ncbi:MAG: hypothetical protein R3B72_10855 [Polyangiaceae bacterium]